MSKYLQHQLKGRHLTQRELQVLALIAGGHSNHEIAEILGLNYETIKNYVSNIMGKLGAKNRTHAASMVLSKQEPQKEGTQDAAVRYIPCPIDSTDD